MLRNMKLAFRIILGLALVLLVSGIVTTVSIVYMGRIADTTETMFNYPYKAHTTALSIQAGVASIAREMKDLVLASDAGSRQNSIDKIAELQYQVLYSFALLFETFSGDPELIDAAMIALNDWEPIRNQVIRYLEMGDTEKAAEISRTLGTPQVEYVESLVQKIVDQAALQSENFNLQARQEADSAANFIVMLMIAAVVVAVAASILITRSITKPVKGLVALADQVAAGNLAAVDVDYQDRDEIGKLAVTLNKMKADLRSMVQSVKDSVAAVRSSAEQMSAGAQENSASVQELANSANEFASAVERLNQSTQELSSLAQHTNELAAQGTSEVGQVVQAMNEIDTVVSGLARKINDLGRHSDEIGSIVSIITGIADQTNLLALNAAIEAARAGEQGRGFAVVADEVRKLAEQSAQAAGEITNLILRIREAVQASVAQAGDGTGKVKAGLEVVAHTGRMFGEIAEVVDALTRGIAQIAATSAELAAGAEEMSATTEQQSASVQQMASSAAGVARAVEEVDKQMNRFQMGEVELTEQKDSQDP